MKENLSKKKAAFILVVVCLVGILGIGFSFAYWRYSSIQDNPNVGMSKCFSLELANQANEINLANIYPITDEEGRKLTPYTFTLKNTCSMSAKYTLNLEMLEGTTLNSKFVAVLVNDEDIKLLSDYDTATTVIDGSGESRILDTGVLASNETKDYSISIWMDKSVTLSDDAQNKVFKSKVVIDAVAVEIATDKIIASVDTTGKCPTINSDGTVNVTGVEATDGYLCKAKDVYGTSYYYRGNVNNNYIYFAGFYWRIVRINGDGSVRVIYDGTKAHNNGENSEDRQIGKSAFNDNYDDNAYVGYMYGDKNKMVEDASQYSTTTWANTSSYYVAKEYIFNENNKTFTLKDPVAVLTTDLTADYIGYYTAGSTSISSSYSSLSKITSITAGDEQATIGYSRLYTISTSKEAAQTNTNSSTIKTYLDNWYKNNILGTENEQYLADNIFCNDRSTTNLGYGENTTYYNWYKFYTAAGKSKLMCTQQNDAFTVSDTKYGNGALTYPIGLISTDEVVLAGGYITSNSGYYLYSGSWYWTLSPSYFSGINALLVSVHENGGVDNYNVFSYGGVRPVLNLSKEVLNNGDGSMENPYQP